MIVKSYFDGAKRHDSDQVERAVIATVCGTADEWKAFEIDWARVLAAHGADFLHTTDAVSLKNEFSVEDGWNDDLVNALIEDCVTVIEGHIYGPGKVGLCVITLNMALEDYVRARQTDPKLPPSAYEIFATESLSFCFKWGTYIGAEYFHLYYDQGEPFYGHIDNRMRNKKARKAIPLLNKVIHYRQSDMRLTHPLQMADLFAWCISHNDGVSRSWHKRLHSLYWHSLFLDYSLLLKSRRGFLDLTASWTLPTRAATKLAVPSR